MNHLINRVNYLEALLEFDYKFYLSLYPDLRNAGISDMTKAQSHYLNNGIKENRIKSKRDFYYLYPNFDWKFYVHTYPDVESNETNAIIHFYNIGRHELRSFENPFIIKSDNNNIQFENIEITGNMIINGEDFKLNEYLKSNTFNLNQNNVIIKKDTFISSNINFADSLLVNSKEITFLKPINMNMDLIYSNLTITNAKLNQIEFNQPITFTTKIDTTQEQISNFNGILNLPNTMSFNSKDFNGVTLTNKIQVKGDLYHATIFNNNLCVCGTNYIAYYKDNTLISLGNLNDSCNYVYNYQGKLICGGSFTWSDKMLNYIGIYETSWEKLGNGLPGPVNCIDTDNNNTIFASLRFDENNPFQNTFFYKFDGINWLPINEIKGYIKTFKFDNKNNLYFVDNKNVFYIDYEVVDSIGSIYQFYNTHDGMIICGSFTRINKQDIRYIVKVVNEQFISLGDFEEPCICVCSNNNIIIGSGCRTLKYYDGSLWRTIFTTDFDINYTLLKDDDLYIMGKNNLVLLKINYGKITFMNDFILQGSFLSGSGPLELNDGKLSHYMSDETSTILTSNVLPSILQLKPLTNYSIKSKDIAEHIDENLIYTINGKKGYDKTKLISILIKGLQEQNKIINNLEKRIQTIELFSNNKV